jgi:lipopolysaccharide/colanic/teichoic acid biosynthesis glycosyltransferase
MPRYLECFIAFVGVILFAPLSILIALAIKMNSKGPVFYRALRAGKNGKTFEMLKFRTMVNDADRSGPPITTKRDPRITAVGAFLRKTKLDELPQIINVLKGDMRFVGPRPEDPGIVKKYSDEQKRILKYRPGITSPSSILYRAEEELIPAGRWDDVYMTEILPKKLDADFRYMERATIFSDLKVIIETVFKK